MFYLGFVAYFEYLQLQRIGLWREKVSREAGTGSSFILVFNDGWIYLTNGNV